MVRTMGNPLVVVTGYNLSCPSAGKAAKRSDTDAINFRLIEMAKIHPLPLGEGAKREPDRAKLQVRVRVSRFDENCNPHTARQPAGCRAALSQRERDMVHQQCASCNLAGYLRPGLQCFHVPSPTKEF